MRLLIIGSEGQLARSLVEQARSQSEIEIVCVGRPELDLNQRGSASAVIGRSSADAVINTAGYTAVDAAETNADEAFRVNAEGAGEVAASAASIGVPVIYFSTDYVFDGRSAEPYDEEAETNPVNVYGRSKLAGEEQVRAANADHLIIRTAWVYSPFGRNFVRTVIGAAEERDELRVVDDQVGSPTFALDLAEGVLIAIDAIRRGRATLGHTYHLAGNGSATWFDLAEAIMGERRKLGLRTAEVIPVPSSEWVAAARRPHNSALNSCRFAADFGYSCPQWTESLPIAIEQIART